MDLLVASVAKLCDRQFVNLDALSAPFRLWDEVMVGELRNPAFTELTSKIGGHDRYYGAIGADVEQGRPSPSEIFKLRQ